MVPESKDGGELTISFRLRYPLFYSHGPTPPRITYFVISSCGSTSTSVRDFIRLIKSDSNNWFYILILFYLKIVIGLGFVQYLQFRYQQGCLYRLKALGERHDMDITIEGFHSWMWRGLSFLLPFLYLGYFYQLYNAWALYQLSFHPGSEWQVKSEYTAVFNQMRGYLHLCYFFPPFFFIYIYIYTDSSPFFPFPDSLFG